MLIIVCVKCDLCTNQDESGFLREPKGHEGRIPDTGYEWWLVNAQRAVIATRTQGFAF